MRIAIGMVHLSYSCINSVDIKCIVNLAIIKCINKNHNSVVSTYPVVMKYIFFNFKTSYRHLKIMNNLTTYYN